MHTHSLWEEKLKAKGVLTGFSIWFSSYIHSCDRYIYIHTSVRHMLYCAKICIAVSKYTFLYARVCHNVWWWLKPPSILLCYQMMEVNSGLYVFRNNMASGLFVWCIHTYIVLDLMDLFVIMALVSPLILSLSLFHRVSQSKPAHSGPPNRKPKKRSRAYLTVVLMTELEPNWSC